MKTAPAPSRRCFGRGGAGGKGSVKLFIVEDSVLMRQTLRQAFSAIAGLEVVGEAAGAQEAIEAIRTATPDVVILDIHLSQGSGLDVLRAVKADRPAVVAVVMSAFLDPEYRRACRELGADHIFDKAAESDQLIRVVRQLAERTDTRPSS